jgi:hypothetical protein
MAWKRPEKPPYAPRKAFIGMDLTKTYPRSPREKLGGVVMLARTTDKARASQAGTTGEYHFGCPMDVHVLTFLGSDPGAFSKKVAELRDDAKIEAWAREQLTGKSADEIERFNADFAEDAPEPGSDGEKFMISERTRLGRADLSKWFDLLDLDEGRPVPQPSAA